MSVRVKELSTGELTGDQVRAIRALLHAAFATDPDGSFTDDDWRHALHGRHFILDRDGEIVAHAAVVERDIRVGGRPLWTGYVEAVATEPSLQGRGFGTLVMRAVGSHIAATYELGALGTGTHGFYERLGWRTWRGPSSVRLAEGERRTPDEDGFIMVLPTSAGPPLDLTEPISCESRPGDVW